MSTPPTAADAPHLVINGFSIGSGGGYTVARELFRGIAAARPAWRLTIALITEHPLHEEMRQEELPPNTAIHWAPASARPRASRLKYERGEFIRWCADQGVACIMMLNGQTIPRCPIPVFSHNQDPWPYRPEAWTDWKERAIAFIKRREHKRGMLHARVYGWTSNYLRKVVTGWHKVSPRTDGVFYNGLPDAWLNRARTESPMPIADRPMQIVTVSNVSIYKRQEMVVRAVAALRESSGLQTLTYRVIGHGEPTDLDRVRALATALGVQDAVFVEGRVSGARVEQAMRESRAFVLMSVCESFGIPAIEAMTFGTPAVVSDCCAHPEVCGDAAALVREDDLDHLIETLRRVLTDEVEARRLGEAGRTQAQKFKWTTTVEQMLVHLDPIMAGT